MATSKACALFLLVSATSALFLSATVVDAVCVPRKLPVPPQKLPQTRPSSNRTPSASVAPKKLPPTSAPAFVRTSPASVVPKKHPETSAFFIQPLPQPLTSVTANKAVQVVDQAVVEICHKTDYPEVCIPSVSAHLTETSSVLSVLRAEIKACTEKTTTAAADVAKLTANPSTSASEKMALSTCKENYGSALDSLSRGQKAIAAGDIGTLNSELSAVITYATTCDDAFAEMSVKLPLPAANRILQKLGSNCLAIAAQAV